jgi:hypothetical protein
LVDGEDDEDEDEDEPLDSEEEDEDDEPPDSDEEDDDDDDDGRPLADDDDERESVMYQPLPLNTMPTGWMTLRNVPPHCSQVVRGGSEKLWRFSMTSLHAVQV